MTRQPRFELVRTTAGHHARFRAANGQVVWTTEVYKRRGTAERAIELVTGNSLAFHGGGHITVTPPSMRRDVVEVDER